MRQIDPLKVKELELALEEYNRVILSSIAYSDVKDCYGTLFSAFCQLLDELNEIIFDNITPEMIEKANMSGTSPVEVPLDENVERLLDQSYEALKKIGKAKNG